MFEPISENLSQLAGFAVLGFFLAALYEPLRILRLFRRQGALTVGMQDFIFLTLAGLISFAYSMELGSGSFRFFFLAGEFFGALLYFITVGKLISLISDIIVRGIKLCLKYFNKYITKPVLHIVANLFKHIYHKLLFIYNLCVEKVKNISKGLKTKVIIVYNKKNQKNKNKGNTKNVIKATVRTFQSGKKI